MEISTILEKRTVQRFQLFWWSFLKPFGGWLSFCRDSKSLFVKRLIFKKCSWFLKKSLISVFFWQKNLTGQYWHLCKLLTWNHAGCRIYAHALTRRHLFNFWPWRQFGQSKFGNWWDERQWYAASSGKWSTKKDDYYFVLYVVNMVLFAGHFPAATARLQFYNAGNEHRCVSNYHHTMLYMQCIPRKRALLTQVLDERDRWASKGLRGESPLPIRCPQNMVCKNYKEPSAKS